MTDPRLNLKNPIHLLATGFGCGLLKPGPGTWGTLAAAAIYLLLVQLPFITYAIIVALALLAGIYICGKTAGDMGEHDHGAIVWDEFAGFWVTMLAVTWQYGQPHIIWIAAGFVLFRIFDIFKPFPIGWLDRKIHGGLGIMLDDLLAGLCAMGMLYIVMQVYLEYIVRGL